MTELEKVQSEYIKFLENEVGNLSSFAAMHGWVCPEDVYRRGEEYRNQIKQL